MGGVVKEGKDRFWVELRVQFLPELLRCRQGCYRFEPPCERAVAASMIPND